VANYHWQVLGEDNDESNDGEPKEADEADEYKGVEEHYDWGDGWDEGEQSTKDADAEEKGKDEEPDEE